MDTLSQPFAANELPTCALPSPGNAQGGATPNYGTPSSGIVAVPIQPTLAHPWKIYGYGVSVIPAFQASTGKIGVSRGDAAQINVIRWADIWVAASKTPLPSFSGSRDLPKDVLDLAQIYNGKTDANPPRQTTSGLWAGLGKPSDITSINALSHQANFAQPVEIHSGENLYIGLFMAGLLGWTTLPATFNIATLSHGLVGGNYFILYEV